MDISHAHSIKNKPQTLPNYTAVQIRGRASTGHSQSSDPERRNSVMGFRDCSGFSVNGRVGKQRLAEEKKKLAVN